MNKFTQRLFHISLSIIVFSLASCQPTDDQQTSAPAPKEAPGTHGSQEVAEGSQEVAEGYEEIAIWSEGVRLVGRIYTPENMPENTKLPGLLLVNGWGGTVENTTDRYARIFAKSGYVVLTQDYKGWGKSNGPLYLEKYLPAGDNTEKVTVKVKHIRHVVDPISFLADTEAALDVLTSDPRVQSKNIGVWGTSMGAGVALPTVANNSNVTTFVSQIGAVNHSANFFMIPERTIREAEAGVARGMIPSFPDITSKLPHLNGNPNYISIKRFEPFDFVDKINVPTLVIDAHDEELFDRLKNGKALHEALKDRVDSHYMTLPGKHYDIYRQESPKAIKATIEWFDKYLKGE